MENYKFPCLILLLYSLIVTVCFFLSWYKPQVKRSCQEIEIEYQIKNKYLLELYKEIKEVDTDYFEIENEPEKI